VGGQEEHPAAGTFAAADQADGRSPPPLHLMPGEKTGHYRAEARDTPIADEKGESRISVGDYAAAVTDTLENESFIRARFTVAY
jgi:putative NADH-flavin reductase